MVFEEYEVLKNNYLGTQREYDEIINEKEEIFNKTQSRAITYDKEKVKSNNMTNSFDNYLIELERKKIGERLTEAKSLLSERKNLLNIKESELRDSKAFYDNVYVLLYLENMEVSDVALKLNYSRSQIYRIKSNIDKRCDKMRQKLC